MLGQPATLEQWSANVEVANLVEEVVTSRDDFDYRYAKLNRRLAKYEAQIASFGRGESNKSAETLFKELNRLQLLMDMNFIEYTPSDELMGYDAVLAGLQF